ncbi:hypothetical protein RM574_10170 [Streptomyces sp. DSM 41982]|uniref:Hydrogenase expression protein HypF n=3 Tax=Streptomyces TaxID=1883 RepID=A0ABD5E336_9ACTN|nr:hypothetical protein [Streptomyces sp. DSM 41982]MDT0415855.1 hypothetical protein [Streptomyces sp. DSM 41982]
MGTVPNDELHPGEERRSGPRHAAPRKSVLTKFRIPAGKAMALAAMPTAVFVGMGLTPRLALADDKTDLPFAPGPCVTRSDEPGQEPSGSASASTKPSPSPSESASPGASPSPSVTPNPSASDEAKDKAEDKAEDEAKDGSGSTAAGKDEADAAPGAKTAKKERDEPSASPTPSASETRNPLDPLGVGDALKDLFTPKDQKDADASAEEKPAEDDKAADGRADDAADPKAQDEAQDKAEDKTADAESKGSEAGDSEAGDAAGDKAADAKPRTLKDDLSDAARAAGASEEDIAEGARKAEEQNAKGPQDEKADGADAGKDDGPEPYPCPTHDAKALADADVDESYPRVAEDPWTLHTTKLSLHGLGYDGIVKVRTASGKIKNVLKFTASGIDIKDLHQTAVGPGAYTTHVKGAPGSTSKIRDGKVTMYTEELKGKLLGLIPVDFTPDSPPPLTLPELFFTDVTVVQAGQFGGTLTIPGLHNYLDKSGS